MRLEAVSLSLNGKMENHLNGTAEIADDRQRVANSHETNQDHIPPNNLSITQNPRPGHSATQLDDVHGDDTHDPSKGVSSVADPDTALPSVKTEPTNSILETVPANDELDSKSFSLDGTSYHPTSKKVANLKNNGRNSRASSSDRSSPANSVKPASNKKSGSAVTKKGTAKKPTNKKRKGNDADAESVDGRRSNTPASSTSKTPGKRQTSTSVAGSPAPEERNKKKKKNPGKRQADDENDEDFEDENEIFCICRRPDNHTWMIGCDGGCEDWFHGKCVKIDPRDADLIEKYICEFTPWLSAKHVLTRSLSRPELQRPRQGSHNVETDVPST